MLFLIFCIIVVGYLGTVFFNILNSSEYYRDENGEVQHKTASFDGFEEIVRFPQKIIDFIFGEHPILFVIIFFIILIIFLRNVEPPVKR